MTLPGLGHQRVPVGGDIAGLVTGNARLRVVSDGRTRESLVEALQAVAERVMKMAQRGADLAQESVLGAPAAEEPPPEPFAAQAGPHPEVHALAPVGAVVSWVLQYLQDFQRAQVQLAQVRARREAVAREDLRKAEAWSARVDALFADIASEISCLEELDADAERIFG